MSMKHLSAALLIFFGAFVTSCKSDTKSEKHTEAITEKTIEKQAALELEIAANLGEGAFWNYKSNELYWIDIEDKKLHIYNPKTKEDRVFNTPSRIGTVVPKNAKEAVIALEDGIYIINTQTGDLKLLSDIEHDLTQNRFNDGKCDPSGRFWVGSLNLKEDAASANLYMIDTKGQTTLKIDSVTISNGIVWTKDKKTMYYIDTPTGKIMGYDYDNKTGDITNGRVAVTVSDTIGYPDGMTIDENDNLWVGLWNGHAVGHFDPKSGKLLDKIQVPVQNVTSCAFGGENLDTLYITTASRGISEEDKKLYPLSGSVFKAVPGVKGVKGSFFGNQYD